MPTFIKPFASPVLALVCVSIIASNAYAASARKERHASASESKASYSATTIPGSIVRWSAPGTTRCATGKKSWAPLGETCYYPFDARHKPGVVTVTPPVLAVADGTVVIAEDLFYPGNALYVDHGDGLVTETFHLSQISVKVGDAVKQGDVLGKVGTTGRSTGPHLFFGTRWHGARVNPRLLLEDPSRLTAIK